MSINRRIVYLIVTSFCFRLLIAYLLELGNDEVYYYTYALNLQWNYFDHPQGVALLIKFCTLNLWLTNELFVRLGAILCEAVGTWLCYKTGSLIRNERTGFYAAVLYNTSIYTSIIAGTFILPDSPQVIFWLAALFVLLKIINQDQKNFIVPVFYWVLFGLLSGLCIQCKVHGIFLWLGLGLYVLIYNRKMLVQPGIYISLIITLIVISPIVIWNINNHFITWTYHSNRIEAHRFNLNISSFLQSFFGQLFYNNPVNVFLIVKSISVLRRKHFLQSFASRILLLTGLPIILVVTIISLFNPALPHWSGPGFVTLSFIAAAYLDEVIKTASVKLPPVLKGSALLIIIVIVGGIAFIDYYPGTIGSPNKNTYGAGDFTLDMNGWRSFEKRYSIWLKRQSNSGFSQLKIVSNKWFPAAHIEYYIARPTHTSVVGVGNINDLHNFAWLNQAGRDLNKGDDALTIIPSNYNTDAEAVYMKTFSSVTNLQTFIVERNGKTARYFTVYLLKNYQPNDEAHATKIK